MITGKSFGSGIQTTINPSRIGAGATSVHDIMYRPWFWFTDPMDEREQVQNNFSLVTLAEGLPPATSYVMTNPSGHWRVENRLNLFTYLTVAMSATDTKINVAEPKLAKVGWRLRCPETNQMLVVMAVNEDLSLNWENEAHDACNVTVNRTKASAHSIPAAINAEVRVALPMLGEKGMPKEGISEVPGDSHYNFAEISALYVQMTAWQRNSLMAGDYGTHEKLIKDNELLLAVMRQESLLGGVRKSFNDEDEGMVYQGNGIVAQCHSNVLNLGNVGNNATYDVMSDFWDGTCESGNSSSTKIHMAGDRHYMNLLTTARQVAAITKEDAYYNPKIGVDEFNCKTNGGKTITVQRHSQAMNGSYANCGLTLDMNQMARGVVAGYEEWKWSLDLSKDTMQGLTLGTDAIIGSQMIALLDADCFGFVRGGTIPILKNRNTVNGVITDISAL